MQKNRKHNSLPFPTKRPAAGFSPLAALSLLLALPGLTPALAQAPAVTYAGPLVITQGGTYTGNFRSTDSSVPVISIQTTQPVIIENCILAGAGDLIDGKNGGDNLVIRNNKGYGLTQTVDNKRHGRFLEVNSAKSVLIEHNYFEHTTGIDIYQWGGNGTASQTLTVRYNSAKNIDGRYRNGGGTYCNFLGMNGALGLVGAEIAWNEIINEPNQSLVEDNINFYNSSGTASSPLNLHDNYVQGAYPYPATGSSYTGSGITIDGDAQTAGGATAFINGYNNQLVSTCAAMNIASGHDNHYYNNRMVTSGLLPDGSKMPAGYAAAGLWNAYQQSGSVFFNNDMTNNVIGFFFQGGNTPYTNRQDTSPGACPTCTSTTHLPDRPLTLADEQNEWAFWTQKLQQNGITLGVGGSGAPAPAPAPAPTSTPGSIPTNATFLRAINVGGAATSIDGRNWEDGNTAANFTFSGSAFANQGVALTPTTDAARATMIRSSVYSSALAASVSGIASGTYSVYLYVWEDNYAQTFSISLEGQTVQSGYNSGAAGHWDRLGPFTTAVTDGTINLTTSGGDANLSGIEIWKQNGTSTSAPTPPTVSLSAPASGTVGSALTLTASAASTGGTIARVEFFSGATKLGEDLSAPYTLSYTPTAAGTLSLTARATDNAGATTTSAATNVSVASAPVSSGPTFVRGINLGGAATTVDGRAWAASTGAANFQATGVTTFANQGVALTPATDAARATMIRSSMYGTTPSLAIGGIASGTYSVYLYVWEDNYAQTFSISLEGQTVQSNYNSGAAGHWDRLGPFTTAVTDGTINLTTSGGDANLSGIEIWKQP